MIALSILTAVLAALLVLGTARLLRLRAELKLTRDLGHGSPIPAVPPRDVDPIFEPDATGLSLASEVSFVGTGVGAPCLTSDVEAWVLAVLSRKARRMFEFGTASGRTAYLWARNSPPDATVTTLTLAPEQQASYRAEAGDAGEAGSAALRESIFTRFLYTGTPVEPKITQLFGDSKAFDDAPYAGACDLVFVDGSHAYSYVKSDTEKALRMLAPGGVVVWHDYRRDLEHTRGVVRHLDELATRLPIRRIAGTSLAFHRAAAP